MFNLQNIHYQYSDTPLLEDIIFAINKGDVIALIGENGAGKTTLLKILLGDISPHEGMVSCNNEVVGYVPQTPVDQSLCVKESFKDILQWRIEYALSLVSLDPELCDRKIHSLSGGQKTRLAFAQVLAQDPEPSILLLDEPTNNIDTEGITWLRQFIELFQGAIVLVSHDRSFINCVATKVVELKNCQLKHYGGNYDFYHKQRVIERQQELKEYQAYLEEKKRLEVLVRNAKRDAKHGTRKKKAPDNDKCLWTFKNENIQAKAAGRGTALETRLKKLSVVDRPEQLSCYNFSLNGTVDRSKKVIELKGISKYYNGSPAVHDVSVTIRGNERLHVSGANGAGKSTLLSLMAGLATQDSGEILAGDNIQIGYFAQESDALDSIKTTRENIEQFCDDSTRIYRAASHFGLTINDLKKYPPELSRGQQAKLAFTKLLLGNFQLLILDEPTNHLDIPTKERLESALRYYQGALAIASHDRYFMNNIDITSTLNL